MFDLDDQQGRMLDEVYHSTWFNESRQIESVKGARRAWRPAGPRVPVVPDQAGGACVPYGASIVRFRHDLGQCRPQWLVAVYVYRATG